MGKWNFICAFLALLMLSSTGQESLAQDNISFRGLVKENGIALQEQEVELLITIKDQDAVILYEEEQSATTNTLGILSFAIGSGTVTDNSENLTLDLVDWSQYPIEISVFFRFDSGDEYEILQTNTLNSVVYAYYAPFATGEDIDSGHLLDINNQDSVQEGHMLRYSGDLWNFYPGQDIAHLAGNVDQTVYSDTALFAYQLNDDSVFNYRDSLLFAFHLDTVFVSHMTSNSQNSEQTIHADTASFALSVEQALSFEGNTDSALFGSLSNTKVILSSNDQNRVKIGLEGDLNFLGASVDSGMSVHVEDAFLVEYIEDSSDAIAADELVNSFYWNPRKRSLHLGNSMLYQLPDSGNYSLSGGSNNKVNSYSFAWGENNMAIGNNVVVFGRSSSATRMGNNQFASGVAMGDNSFAFRRCVGLGHYARAIPSETGGNSNVAIGMNISIFGSGSTALGNNITSEALVGGAAIGSNINSGFYYGSFLFSDSSSGELANEADYEFRARASGGTTFYTDTLMTMGVDLSSGSGSWTSVSDIHMKENFYQLMQNSALELIKALPVYTWNYLTQTDDIIHLGPLSNDLRANGLFTIQKLNEYHTINAADMDGLIFLGIKEISGKMDELIREADEAGEPEEENGSAEEEMILESIENRLKNLEKRIYDE